MTISYHEAVEFDLSDGRAFYDRQNPGIGDYFVDSVLADTESLVLYAGIHSEKWGFFRMLGSRFPFGVYYLLEDEEVVVYAILDMRREPSWIRSELAKRG